MNQQGDEQLIDRHMAGVLRPEEESRLERLIRSSPEWARRYREAEELMRLVRKGIGQPNAPRDVKDRIHRLIAEDESQASLVTRSRSRWPRVALAAAAVLLLALGLSMLTPDDGDGLLPVVYADEAWPVKDLARSADVLLVGRTERVGDSVRLRLERIVFGEIGDGAVKLPRGIRPDQAVALFGRHTSDTVIEVVGGLAGVVHLDGVQRWDGRDLTADEVARRVEQAGTHRTLDSALLDLRTFLDTDASLDGELDGLRYSGAITARFLGRFEADLTREQLMALVMAPAKHPEARNAGAAALVEADPVGACRRLLSRIVSGPVERMHAETEDGLVLLGCLHLIQESGPADLAGDLGALEERLRCGPLRRAVRAARDAVRGVGARTPPPRVDALPARLQIDGHEGVVLPGCEGRREGLIVVWMEGGDPLPFRLLASVAVDRGLGVLLLPEDVIDVRPWLAQAAERVDITSPLLVGVGTAADAAVHASRQIQARELVLVDAPARTAAEAPARARLVSPPDDSWTRDLELLNHILEP